MKTRSFLSSLKLIIAFAILISGTAAMAQTTNKDRKLIRDSKQAKSEFVASTHLMTGLFANAYGYVIFPNVGKGGIGIGGAAGNGILYERGNIIGRAQMKQLSIGFQFGGQAYREVIFFESKAELERFREDKFEFSAQASAVVITAGVSANMKYRDGVMVFTMRKGGLMYEAAIGGQKFNYTKF